MQKSRADRPVGRPGLRRDLEPRQRQLSGGADLGRCYFKASSSFSPLLPFDKIENLQSGMGRYHFVSVPTYPSNCVIISTDERRSTGWTSRRRCPRNPLRPRHPRLSRKFWQTIIIILLFAKICRARPRLYRSRSAPCSRGEGPCVDLPTCLLPTPAPAPTPVEKRATLTSDSSSICDFPFSFELTSATIKPFPRG